MFMERQARLTGVPEVRRRVSMPTVDLEDLGSLKKYVGREIGVTGGLSLTQKRIEQFAEATEDRQWIHLDRERASTESPYATTIAHGFLTLSLLSNFVREPITIGGGSISVNFGLNAV